MVPERVCHVFSFVWPVEFVADLGDPGGGVEFFLVERRFVFVEFLQREQFVVFGQFVVLVVGVVFCEFVELRCADHRHDRARSRFGPC